MATTPTPTATSTSPPPPSPPPPQDHHNHPSPSPTTPTNPSSPKPIKPAPTPKKKIQPLPWTYPETTNLIQAYQDKWYSLKRGQLKASQWEEVSVTVAVLCGGHDDEPSKSATQCRHKIEKLRKRYRAEKQKPNPNYWPFFDLMDRMERGPLPISARPMSMIQYQKSNSSDDDNVNDDDDEEDEQDNDDYQYYDDPKKKKAKSINHIVRNHGNVNKSNFNIDKKSSTRVLQTPMLRKRKECFESDDNDNDNDNDDDDNNDDEEEEEDEDGGEREVVAGLAAEIRAFAESFVRMENKKMEMMRETQRFRMEMENKKMEMILESQRKMVDTIGRAFGSHKKLKMAQES